MTLKWKPSPKVATLLCSSYFQVQTFFRKKACETYTMNRFSNVIAYFTQTVLKKWGSLYNIRQAPKLLNSEQLIIRPKTNKYCGNVQRQHSHNAIYIHIDIPGFTYTQRCLANGCRGYYSDYTALEPALFFKRVKLSEPA